MPDGLLSACGCRRCLGDPSPVVLGDRHHVAVVLNLTADQALDVAAHMSARDLGRREIEGAVARWTELTEDPDG